jgi:hypothetical protein
MERKFKYFHPLAFNYTYFQAITWMLFSIYTYYCIWWIVGGMSIVAFHPPHVDIGDDQHEKSLII